MEKSNKDIACAISVFINKHYAKSSQVEWPDWEFRIKAAGNPEIDEASLKEYGADLWTFRGTVEIVATDTTSQVKAKRRCGIIGSAVINFKGSKELLPEVKHVIITKIQL
ncbi:MAG: hypothetical protein J1F13_00885 [Prevotellaceae bacterium]|nr:hypothetical protein [Prevotellaceae bacterium]